jgi:hypothetical protein
MSKSVPFGMLLIAILPAYGQHHRPVVTFESPTVCRGFHGFWRWTAKNDTTSSPDREDPDREVAWYSPRFGREREWFAVTGRVARVEAEEDGDLHIELRDADNPHGVYR